MLLSLFCFAKMLLVKQRKETKMAKANKWANTVTLNGVEMTAAAAAVSMYDNGNGSTPDEIADFLGDEFHGSTSKNRKVISKLTTEGVYKKPQPKAKAPREPQIVKADLVANVEEVLGEKIDDLSRLNLDSLKTLAVHIGAEMPDPR
jgi:hypothetical protein